MKFIMKCPPSSPHRPNGSAISNLVSLSATTESSRRLVPVLNFVQLCLIAEIFKLMCSKFECREDIHFRTQPGPVAKNATPRPPAGN